MLTKTCDACGGEFRTKRAAQVVCNTTCRNLLMAARNRSDPAAQAARGKLGGAVRGAQLRAGRSSDWYLKESGQHVHRVVAAEVLGRPLRPGEVVHHEDRDKTNNDPANLIVFASQAWHARHHKLDHCGLDRCTCQGIRLKEVI